MNDEGNVESDRLARRTLLQGAALTGVAAALAGCGAGEADPSPAPAASEVPTPQDSPQDSPSKDQGGAEALAAVADIPVAGGLIIAEKVVVTQPEKGTFKAFSAICTHQGCPVDDVTDGVISCPCHGSQYSASDGSVIAGPAPSPLPEVPISVEDGQVVRA